MPRGGDRLPEYVTFSEYSAQHPRLWLRRPGRPGAWIDLFIFDCISERPAAAKLRLLGCAFFLAFTKSRTSLEISRRAGLHRGLKGALMVTSGYHELLVKSYGGDYMTPRREASHDNPAHAGFIGALGDGDAAKQ